MAKKLWTAWTIVLLVWLIGFNVGSLATQDYTVESCSRLHNIIYDGWLHSAPIVMDCRPAQ